MMQRDENGGLKLRLAVGVFVVVVAVVASVLMATRHTSKTDDQAGGGPQQPTPSTSVLVLADPRPPRPVLTGAHGAAISGAAVAASLSDLLSSPRLGRHVAVEVATVGGKKPLYATADGVVIPASITKLLTTMTALAQLGPDHRFETTVVEGERRNQVILHGGGDPLLTDQHPESDDPTYPTRASLADLAAQAAATLKAAGRSKVVLGYDDSLFSGPAVNLTWEADYIPESIVSPISALWVDEGRAVEGLAQRGADPSLEAARRFSELLARRGINVVGPPSPAKAAAGSELLASVSSAPLAQIVQHVLELSDNEGAEVLLRQAAIAAGEPGSFVGGVSTVRQTLTELGVDLAGAQLYDGSGLSRLDRLSVSTVVDVLQIASSPRHPELRSVVSTLPVAGFSGSLDYRFVVDAPDGLGMVRAKTGTLTGVHGMAGIVVTSDGVPLIFAAVADDVPVRRALDARAQLDRIGAALATCC
jgi:D-alanyl-D-alanine carboxypeptidase/D-alanyl-D-alanine-endopeptidase (penicillin-binding protein 4)